MAGAQPEALRPPKANHPPPARAAGSGTVWWGEATDEPARGDARPTKNRNYATAKPPVVP